MGYLFIIIWQGLLSRLSGSGFGQKWGVSWLPELVFALTFGVAHAYLWYALGFSNWIIVPAFFASTAISYFFMQSGTWMFLRWESHDNPNTTRGGTLKPIIDWIAARFGYKLGDEGYAWTAAGVKGFLIGLPVGGIPLAFLWPLGYEVGSHADKVGMEPDIVREIAAGVGAGIAIVLWLLFIRHIIL